MKKLFAFFILGYLLNMTIAIAANKSPLYQVDIFVTSQSESARIEAIQQGLLQVLVRISGDTQIEKNSTIKAALPKASDYLSEYSYSTHASPDTPYYLEMRFDRHNIEALLMSAGVGSWGENRPSILIWLTAPGKNHITEIIGSETASTIFSIMQQQGKKYGLPLIFPMLDITDLNQVSIQDIESVALSTIKTASQRYAPNAYLIGSIHEKNNLSESNWKLIYNDKKWDWNITKPSIQDVLANIMENTSRALSKHNAQPKVDSQPLWVTLQVSNITQRNDITSLVTFLKQFTFVQQVQLAQVRGDIVELNVLIHGATIQTFEQSLSEGQYLDLRNSEIARHLLIYEWIH